MKNNTALITGASGGIGMELARIHAKKGGNLVLVARSEGKLNDLAEELKAAHSVEVTVIAADLAKAEAAQQIFERTEQQGIAVDVLINNAGFGGHGIFHEQELAGQLDMMQVNMTTLTALTHHYLPGMVERKHGRILNVSSTASFMPGPLQAVYYATKAFVTSFTQALAEELSGTGVTTTALCPGPVMTGFADAANLDGVEAFDKGKSAESVAAIGYKAMEKGKLVIINEAGLSFILNWVTPFLPRRTVLKLSRRFMEKS